jgi:hypothetical protein
MNLISHRTYKFLKIINIKLVRKMASSGMLRRVAPYDAILHSHRHEDLKSYIKLVNLYAIVQLVKALYYKQEDSGLESP